MASRRQQIAAGAGALALLGGAWALSRGGGTPPASVGEASTTIAPSTSAPATASTTRPAGPPPAGVPVLVDVTADAGLDEPQAAGTPEGDDNQTGGAAVGDLDADGDLDLVLPRVGLPTRVLANDGRGRFTEIAEPGLGGDAAGYAAAVLADVDGDADLDLYRTGAGNAGPSLALNDGAGGFTDATADSGLAELAPPEGQRSSSYGAAFDDWDGDGDLDLVTLHWYRAPLDAQLLTLPPPTAEDLQSDQNPYDPCTLAERRRTEGPPPNLPGSRSRLLENDGQGRFSDVTATSGVDVDALIGFQPVFADVDGDGWRDLFLTGDYCTSRLYRNEAGQGFTDITERAGVGTDRNGMGSVVEDLDGDGNLDWFVTSIAAPAGPDGTCPPDDGICLAGGNRLYLGDGTGRFTDATDRFGVRDGSWGWGAVAADLDRDGRLDLAMTNGIRGSGGGASLGGGGSEGDDANRLWTGRTTPPWPEAAAAAGFADRDDGKGLVAFDADGDLDLDLLVVNTVQPPRLYRNDSPAGDEHRSVVLRLRQPGPNPFAVGATVAVEVGDGAPPRTLTVRAGGSFQTGDPTDLHVGLGPRAAVDRITVRWPGGGDPTVLTDVPAGEVLEIERPGP